MQNGGKRLVVGMVVTFVITLFVISIAQAAKGGNGVGGADTEPPAEVRDLFVTRTMHAVILRFTVPGDDGLSGTAAGYDVLFKVEE